MYIFFGAVGTTIEQFTLMLINGRGIFNAFFYVPFIQSLEFPNVALFYFDFFSLHSVITVRHIECRGVCAPFFCFAETRTHIIECGNQAHIDHDHFCL